jgi:hypothetical protein
MDKEVFTTSLLEEAPVVVAAVNSATSAEGHTLAQLTFHVDTETAER